MRKETKSSFSRMISLIKLESIELAIVIIAFISSVITVIFFTKRIFLEGKTHFDMMVFDMIKPHVNDRLTSLINVFTFFGSQYFLVPANLLLIVYSFFVEKNKWFALKVLSVSISSLLLMFFLKTIFQRPRPLLPLLKEVRGLSFPSGHAFMSFAFFGLLIYMVSEKIKTRWLKISLMIFFLLATIAVGFSRIYLRVHYASDVIVGFAISLVWLVISLWILHVLEKNKTRLPPVH